MQWLSEWLSAVACAWLSAVAQCSGPVSGSVQWLSAVTLCVAQCSGPVSGSVSGSRGGSVQWPCG